VVDSWDPAFRITEYFVAMDKPLYLLVHDQQVQAADPEDKLYMSIQRSSTCRTIAQAKALSTEGRAPLLVEGALFDGVPEAALDRFLQLVTAAELSGEHAWYRVSVTLMIVIA
jgi:hypothetical protein